MWKTFFTKSYVLVEKSWLFGLFSGDNGDFIDVWMIKTNKIVNPHRQIWYQTFIGDFSPLLERWRFGDHCISGKEVWEDLGKFQLKVMLFPYVPAKFLGVIIKNRYELGT